MSTIFGYSAPSESQRPKKARMYGKAARVKPAKKPSTSFNASTVPISRNTYDRSVDHDAPTMLDPEDVFDIPDSDEEKPRVRAPVVKKTPRKPPAKKTADPPAPEKEVTTIPRSDMKANLGPKARTYRDPRLKGVPRAADLASSFEKKGQQEEPRKLGLLKDDVQGSIHLPSNPGVLPTSNRAQKRHPSPKKKTITRESSRNVVDVAARGQKRPQEQLNGSRPSKRQTPDRNIVEPVTPANISSARRAPLARSISQTPKQHDLWSQLLPSDPVDVDEETPRASTMDQDATGIVESKVSSPPGQKSQSQRQGSRLVDRLKQGKIMINDDEEDSDEDTLSFEDRMNALENATKPTQRQQHRQGLSREPSALTNSQYNSQQESGPSGLRRTYGESRSYLQDISFEEGLLMPLDTDTPKPPAKSKNTFDPQESEDDTSQGIRSIHELRAAGSKKRFRDDVNTLLDDIKAHTRSDWSRRRSALMELGNRFQDKTFAAQFVECGFDRTLVRECQEVTQSRGIDAVGDSVLNVVLIRYLAADLPRHCTMDLKESGILDFLISTALDTSAFFKMAKDRKANMSKMLQSSFLEYMEEVRTANTWPSEPPEVLTRSILSLRASVVLATKVRTLGHSDPLITAISVQTLISTITTITTDNKNGPELEMALSLLEIESLSVASSDTLQGGSFTISSLGNLAKQMPDLLSSKTSIQASMLTLRLCLNLTNNKSSSCDVFGSDAAVLSILTRIDTGFHQLVNTYDSGPDHHLNSLLLALGLAINLAEYSNSVRRHTVSCSADALPSLVTVFVRGQKLAAEAETQAQLEAQSSTGVGYGYLAVFLGNLCMEPTVKTVIRSHLPDQDLGVLVRSIKEFGQFHQTVDNSGFEGEEGKEVWKTFTSRLMSVAEKIEA